MGSRQRKIQHLAEQNNELWEDNCEMLATLHRLNDQIRQLYGVVVKQDELIEIQRELLRSGEGSQ